QAVVVSLLVLLLYLALGSLITLYARRRMARGEGEFYLAGRRLTGFLSAMTYAATTYSSFMIVGLVGLAFFTGIGSLVFELAYLVATVILLSLFSRRVWRMSRERGWVSPGEMLADLLGSPWVALTASLVFLVSLVPYASAQLKGIAETIVAIAGYSPGDNTAYMVAVGVALLILLAWSLLAGVRGVVLTDAFQGLWMLTAGSLLFLWLASRVFSNSGASEVLSAMESAGLFDMWSATLLIGFVTPWVFFAVTNPQVVQRLYMPKDEESLRRMILYFFLFGLYYTVLVVAIGFLARAGVELGILSIEPQGRDQVTPQLLSLAHPLLAALVFTSIVAASVSTADSIILALASSASRDIGLLVLRLDEKGRLRLGYAAAALFTVLMAVFAATRIGYIVQLSVLSSVMLLGLAPVTIAAWVALRVHPALAVASIATGPILVAANVLYSLAVGGEVSLSPAKQVLGVPISVWVLAVSLALTAAGIALARGMR
ncbi:sodium/solute symporter, partial [Aeropyrum pernix]